MVKALVTILDDKTGKVYQKDAEMPPTSSVSMPKAMCDEYEFHFKIVIAREISMDETRKIWQEQEEKK